MTPRRTIANELTKEMIVEVASQQFQTKGYQHVSMRSLAKELQCSHGALYYHFNNKAELFFEVVSRYFEKLNDLIKKVQAKSVKNEEKLIELLLCYLEFGLHYQVHYEFMFMIKDPAIDALSKRAANQSYDLFAKALGSFSNNDASIGDVYSTFVSLHGFVAHYIHRVNNFPEVEEAAKKHVQFLTKAILS
ncbi:TetR/AcrR family transcriptional regulator [Shouchella miscanthi]|uniref:TetR/AcrR family transcriptional regulator n=1 Tax=Shouchella miscanthi TaxID=2598861 RepID=A0ABU6NML9_9BACI|nr:TetR/AcrR family transcriptional regulator [Shouchella miscanthi]